MNFLWRLLIELIFISLGKDQNNILLIEIYEIPHGRVSWYVDIVVVIISEPPGHCVSGNMVVFG